MSHVFDARSVVEKASSLLYEYCCAWNLHAVVTGVSGGVDSAVVLGLAQRACRLAEADGYKLQSIGLLLPCESDSEHERRGRMVIERFEAIEVCFDLTDSYRQLLHGELHFVDEALEAKGLRLKVEDRVSFGNVKARLRMVLGTYYVANRVGGLVLSTDNYSEYLMGFWTLHGDVGDYGMIQNLWKTEVYELAKVLEVPREVIDAVPEDGLGILSGGDEAQLGASYCDLDIILRRLIDCGFDVDGDLDQLRAEWLKVEGYEDDLVRMLAEGCLRSSFKRRVPIGLMREELGNEEIRKRRPVQSRGQWYAGEA